MNFVSSLQGHCLSSIFRSRLLFRHAREVHQPDLEPDLLREQECIIVKHALHNTVAGNVKIRENRVVVVHQLVSKTGEVVQQDHGVHDDQDIVSVDSGSRLKCCDEEKKEKAWL